MNLCCGVRKSQLQQPDPVRALSHIVEFLPLLGFLTLGLYYGKRILSEPKGASMNVRKLATFVFASAFTLSVSTGYGLAQDNAMKAAGTDTKNAAKDTGKGIATGSKKVAHGTKVGADKTVDGTKTAGKDVGHGTKVAADKTADGTKKVGKDIGHGTKVAAKDTAHGTEKVGDKIAGKPAPQQ
jgi:hypothetical protein